jgi:hypothetical protein
MREHPKRLSKARAHLKVRHGDITQLPQCLGLLIQRHVSGESQELLALLLGRETRIQLDVLGAWRDSIQELCELALRVRRRAILAQHVPCVGIPAILCDELNGTHGTSIGCSTVSRIAIGNRLVNLLALARGQREHEALVFRWRVGAEELPAALHALYSFKARLNHLLVPLREIQAVKVSVHWDTHRGRHLNSRGDVPLKSTGVDSIFSPTP